MKNCRKLQVIGIIALVFLSCFTQAGEKFEKADPIYSNMGGGLNPFWFLGHAGLYYCWETAENANGIAEPENMKKHCIIESNKKKGVRGFDEENKVTFQKFYDNGSFWGVKTIKLSAYQRQQIIATAKSKKDKPYSFFRGYKGPDSFRCDGLVEYCYEQAGVGYFYEGEWVRGIVDDKSWMSLTPKKQMNYLADPARFDHYTPQFDLIEFGELEDVICIDGEPVEPDNDGYYHINKNCTVKAYADDGENGSGIARFELWLEETDDTPDEMPGKRLKVFNEEYKRDHDYSYDWDISDVEPGEYELYAKAFDQAGNTKETYINVKIEKTYYFHVQLSPEYVETGSPVSQTQTFTLTVQCYNNGTGELQAEEGKKYVNKKAGTESWWWYNNGLSGDERVAEWRKEKINPNCIVPEQWEKSAYAGEVSFGLNTSGYELYAGGEKLETLELVDGTGSISVVIKAEDGDIRNDRLFLIISASDGTGSGNNALMVNPILVSVSFYDDGETSPMFKECIEHGATADEAWAAALHWYNNYNFRYSYWGGGVCLRNFLSYGDPPISPEMAYTGGIIVFKTRLTVNLTAYDPADYVSAFLVVKPRRDGQIYYCPQGWIEDEYNTLRNMKSELGKVWISAECYGEDHTPSRPPLNHYQGYVAQYRNKPHYYYMNAYQGFYVALMPKMPE